MDGTSIWSRGWFWLLIAAAVLLLLALIMLIAGSAGWFWLFFILAILLGIGGGVWFALGRHKTLRQVVQDQVMNGDGTPLTGADVAARDAARDAAVAVRDADVAVRDAGIAARDAMADTVAPGTGYIPASDGFRFR